MRRLHISSSDLTDAPVGSEHDDRSQVALQCSIEVGEALDVKHVHLVNEQHTWDDLGATLLSPLSNFLINLLADLRLDFTNISGKESHKSLSS